MKRLLLAALCLFSLAAEAKVNVVATVTDLGALAREAGGDKINVVTLAKPTQDPHFVDAKPSLVISVARADIIVHMGMELEIGWLPTLIVQSRNEKVQVGAPGYLDCSQFINKLDVPTEKIDRSMGDIHPGGNPHYTKDPRNAVLIVKGIANRLAEVDPSNSATYQANAARFEKEMQTKIAEWQKTLAPFKGTPIITFHKSWTYFADWAGLNQVAFMEPKPGLPPSAQHVAEVIVAARHTNAKMILQEEWYSQSVSQLVQDKTGAKMLAVPGMVAENQRYTDYMDALVKQVSSTLAAK